MRPSRDLLVVGVLFAVLIGFTIFGVARQGELASQQSTYTPYSTHSSLPNGTLALHAWAESLGYRVRRIEYEAFQVPSDAGLLFLFPARIAYEESEAQAIVRWVERGNTLVIVAASRFNANNERLLRALKLGVQPVSSAERLPLSQPLAGVPAEPGLLVKTTWGLLPDRSDYTVYAGDAKAPVIIGWAQGRGRVVALASTFLLSNDGLRDPQNAALARALLPEPGARAQIAFDEYHLGFNRRGDSSLQNLVYNTPWGWAILFSALVIFAYLVINGQRFGRVEPLPAELARRSPAEYATSMAALFRRAGKRQMVLNHYRQQLKRSLGRPYRINAALPDDEFVVELARYREVDRDALLRVLRGLSRHDAPEREIVRLADEAIRLRGKSGGA